MKSDGYVRILHQALGDVITDDVILQHDNGPVHKAEIVNDWLRDNQVLTIDWLSYSPDLNLLENVWAIMKRQLASQHLTFNNVEEVVQMTWTSFALETVSKLYESRPERVQQVTKNRDFVTNF